MPGSPRRPGSAAYDSKLSRARAANIQLRRQRLKLQHSPPAGRFEPVNMHWHPSAQHCPVSPVYHVRRYSSPPRPSKKYHAALVSPTSPHAASQSPESVIAQLGLKDGDPVRELFPSAKRPSTRAAAPHRAPHRFTLLTICCILASAAMLALRATANVNAAASVATADTNTLAAVSLRRAAKWGPLVMSHAASAVLGVQLHHRLLLRAPAVVWRGVGATGIRARPIFKGWLRQGRRLGALVRRPPPPSIVHGAGWLMAADALRNVLPALRGRVAITAPVLTKAPAATAARQAAGKAKSSIWVGAAALILAVLTI